MNAAEQFEKLGMSPENANALQIALWAIVGISADELEKAIETIGRAEVFGPFFDPSFFLKVPKAFDNGRKNRELFEAVLALKRLLPDGAGE